MVRLATYNLLHGVPVLGGMAAPDLDDSGRPTGLTVADDQPLRDAVRLLDADVIGLQEVDVDQPRSGGVQCTRPRAAPSALHLAASGSASRAPTRRGCGAAR